MTYQLMGLFEGQARLDSTLRSFSASRVSSSKTGAASGTAAAVAEARRVVKRTRSEVGFILAVGCSGFVREASVWTEDGRSGLMLRW